MVPSAVSEPRWALHMCDDRCRTTGFKFFETCGYCVRRRRTTCDPCNKCYNGEAEVAASKWRALIEQTASRGKLWAAFGLEQFLCGMWDRFTFKKAWARSLERTYGGWQHEAPYKEELELLRHSGDLRFEGVPLR